MIGINKLIPNVPGSYNETDYKHLISLKKSVKSEGTYNDNWQHAVNK